MRYKRFRSTCSAFLQGFAGLLMEPMKIYPNAEENKSTRMNINFWSFKPFFRWSIGLFRRFTPVFYFRRSVRGSSCYMLNDVMHYLLFTFWHYPQSNRLNEGPLHLIFLNGTYDAQASISPNREEKGVSSPRTLITLQPNWETNQIRITNGIYGRIYTPTINGASIEPAPGWPQNDNTDRGIKRTGCKPETN